LGRKKKEEIGNLTLVKKYKGTETIKRAKFENGQALYPIKTGNEITMQTFDAVKELMAKKDKLTEERKTEKKNGGKVRFIADGNGGVTVKPVSEKAPPKEKAQQIVFVKDLVEALADTGLTTDVDKNSFTNWRSGRTCYFYAIDRSSFGGIGLSTRTNESKSGWETTRVTTREQFDEAVKNLKAMVKNQTKFETAYVWWLLCPECDYKTTNKEEMTAHLGTHVTTEQVVTA